MKILILLLLGSLLHAGSDPNLVESKVQTDLDGLLSRILSRDQYVLTVASQVETVQEKRLVEGETLSQNNRAPSVPPLPGFQSEPTSPTPPQSSRQTFKMVDKEVLQSIRVQLTLDDRVSEELAKASEKAVQGYLSANYSGKSGLQLSRIRMTEHAPLNASSQLPWNSYVPWALLALVLLFTGYRYLQNRNRYAASAPLPANVRSVFPSLEKENPFPETFANRMEKEASQSSKPLALPSGGLDKKGQFPSLPATQEFVDQRSKLLQLFFGHSDRFRLYFKRLESNAQTELYAGLRGPAFDSFLEGLGLKAPEGSDVSTPPTEEQMLFYEKNFMEFLHAHDWQHAQFFGFLQQLTNEQLVSLVKQQNNLVGALMLRFMKPEQSAFVLGALTSKERLGLLSQTDLINRTSTAELTVIEETVRNDLKKLPQYLSGTRHENVEFWSKILSQGNAEDSILVDLEKTDPELYQALAKFRFHLEDVPSLPRPLVSKILDATDNEELAMAIQASPESVREYILSQLVPKRKELIQNHLLMLQGLENEQTRIARNQLTKRFREVMA